MAVPPDVRLAARFLRRNPVFTLATVAILALGIALSATLFTIVRGTLIRPWPYRGYDRIVTLSANYPTHGRTDFSLWSTPEIEDLRRAPDLFEHVIAGDARNVNLTYAGRAERVRAAVITPNAFEMLGVPAMTGRALDNRDAEPGAAAAVLVSYQFWATRLGADPYAVGRTLRIGSDVFTIVGVMPRSFVFWDRDLWMPLRLDANAARTDRRYYVQGQLVPGLSLEGARARLRVLTTQMADAHRDVDEYAGLTVNLNTLVDNVLRDLRPTLYLLLAAVGLVLLVALANLANATLAKAMAREGELAIRRAIGGSIGQIARQLLVESALAGAVGGIAGAGLASFLLPHIVALIPFGYVPAEAQVDLDWRVVALATATAAVFGLTIGALPAIRAGAVDPAAVLRHADARTGSRRSHAWRDGFVLMQLTLAVVVLGVAVAAAASLNEAVRRDPGYTARGVWTARIALTADDVAAHREADVYDRILDRIRRIGSVGETALASSFPVGALPTTLVSAETSRAAQRLESSETAMMVVSPRFFALLGIPLLEGRAFEPSDTAAKPPVTIVTRGLAKQLWPTTSALGRSVRVGRQLERPAIVIGVVPDVSTDGADAAVRHAVYIPVAQQPPPAVVIGLRTADANRALAVVQDAVRDVNADIPVYTPEMLAQSRLDVLGPRLLAVTLLGLFGATVLILSAVGIYAVVSQSVQERAHELRIRLTFGADPGRLLLGELARSGRLIAMSAIVGTIAALAALRIIASAFRGFAGAPWLALTLSTTCLAVLAFAATAIPAWKAVHRNTAAR
ncbi:MAG TPA: ABC transporter permease [Vicinamibacterales bacterium]|jgi:predicted permease